MKRIILLVLSALSALTLISCVPEKGFESVSDVPVAFTVETDTLSAVTGNITLVDKHESYQVSWKTVDFEQGFLVIDGTVGIVTRPHWDAEDALVSFEATISQKNKSHTQDPITITIKALDKPEVPHMLLHHFDANDDQTAENLHNGYVSVETNYMYKNLANSEMETVKIYRGGRNMEVSGAIILAGGGSNANPALPAMSYMEFSVFGGITAIELKLSIWGREEAGTIISDKDRIKSIEVEYFDGVEWLSLKSFKEQVLSEITTKRQIISVDWEKPVSHLRFIVKGLSNISSGNSARVVLDSLKLFGTSENATIPTNQEFLDLAYISLNVVASTNEDIILPSQVSPEINALKEVVLIEWTSSHPDILSAVGKVNLPELSDVAVDLVARLRIGDLVVEKTFQVVVKQKEYIAEPGEEKDLAEMTMIHQLDIKKSMMYYPDPVEKVMLDDCRVNDLGIKEVVGSITSMMFRSNLTVNGIVLSAAKNINREAYVTFELDQIVNGIKFNVDHWDKKEQAMIERFELQVFEDGVWKVAEKLLHLVKTIEKDAETTQITITKFPSQHFRLYVKSSNEAANNQGRMLIRSIFFYA